MACVLSAEEKPGGKKWPTEAQQEARLRHYKTVYQGTIDAQLPDKEFLKALANNTWGYFRDVVDKETGLPLDNVIVFSTHSRVFSYTSTTNIGLYLMCVTAAFDMRFITRNDAVGRIRQVVGTLNKMDNWEGQFYNYYDTATLEHSSHNISSVDNGWLAAGLIVAKQAFYPEVGKECAKIIDQFDFGKFYDQKLGQLFLGYDTQVKEMSPYHYGLICTEPRAISYIAIAKGDVPKEHWYRMYRTLPREWKWQQKKPFGRKARYDGVEYFRGYYRHEQHGEVHKYVPSWGGSMFEFLMPTLILKEKDLAPESFGANNKTAVDIQIHYALNEQGYPVWGISSSSTPDELMGYREYGVKYLGAQGYNDEAVITPHASVLAIEIEPEQTVLNLKKLSKFSKIYGQYGFYDSVNVKTGKVNTKYLCLDQAMSFIALCNYLTNGSIREHFHSEPMIAENEDLLTAEKFY